MTVVCRRPKSNSYTCLFSMSTIMKFSIPGSEQISRAKVIEVRRRDIRIALDPQCLPDAHCGTCTLCAGSRAVHKAYVTVDNTRHFTPGQALTIQRFVVNEALSAALVFGVPLCGAFASIFLQQSVFPGIVQPAGSILASLFGACFGLGICAMADLLIRSRHPIRILSAHH